METLENVGNNLAMLARWIGKQLIDIEKPKTRSYAGFLVGWVGIRLLMGGVNHVLIC